MAVQHSSRPRMGRAHWYIDVITCVLSTIGMPLKGQSEQSFITGEPRALVEAIGFVFLCYNPWPSQQAWLSHTNWRNHECVLRVWDFSQRRWAQVFPKSLSSFHFLGEQYAILWTRNAPDRHWKLKMNVLCINRSTNHSVILLSLQRR